jgi:hypothetical protein
LPSGKNPARDNFLGEFGRFQRRRSRSAIVSCFSFASTSARLRRIMEVLRTVLSYLQERAKSLQPFLFIAAISATRRILAIGAQMSVSGDTPLAEQISRGHDRSGCKCWCRPSDRFRSVPARSPPY